MAEGIGSETIQRRISTVIGSDFACSTQRSIQQRHPPFPFFLWWYNARVNFDDINPAERSPEGARAQDVFRGQADCTVARYRSNVKKVVMRKLMNTKMVKKERKLPTAVAWATKWLCIPAKGGLAYMWSLHNKHRCRDTDMTENGARGGAYFSYKNTSSLC
ncbi:hypothetical protein N658DRAFT_489702 [Parathielavia hyrcaniae]|uniref:Uncharacterized protein n=1 Tax=Parathielavia hyrcaniae TaxID=113614 RepID=A0AAN6PWR5_9PEZI|nr:hypothetical protein N658DRAFT_489702 [Parathielavia hyrcaniae]